jgi:DNA-binding transcriptional LysR family regulator
MVTEAAKELHYPQPSVSHHLGRLEAATGARLIQRVGRGIRLTPEGKLLAVRATEILGRLNAASVELAARVGPRAGRYDSPVSKRSSAPSYRGQPPSCPGCTRESS